MIICARNLSPGVDEEKLRQQFVEFGEVASVTVIKRKGFGFIEMPSDAEGRAAIGALNGKVVDGRKLELNEDEGVKRPGC